MNFPFPETRKRLETTLAAREGSALAMATLHAGKRAEIYLGQTRFAAAAQNQAGAQPAAIDRKSIFDLASLTKVLVTMPLLIEALESKLLRLTSSVSEILPEFPAHEIQVRHLLQHRSGLPAHLEFYKRPEAIAAGQITAENLLLWIAEAPRKPLSEAEVRYSDLGFMLLGFMLERVFAKSLPALLQTKIIDKLGLKNTGFRILKHASSPDRKYSLVAENERFVATANCPFHQRILQGEVDDNNCWAQGGASAHAGLFSTLEETLLLWEYVVARARQHRQEFFPTEQDQPPFKLGFMVYPGLRPITTKEWQGAFGHTGFVGTSCWYHEPTKLHIVLLGNRVHPDRSDTRFIDSRLEIHRCLWEQDFSRS